MKGILVTTKHRGVFFGFVDDDQDLNQNDIWVQDAKNCIYWDAGIKGFWGLARFGPDEKCKIGPSVPRALIKDVTSVAECTSDAIANWKKEIW